MSKTFNSITDQIKILKSRKLTIDNDAYAEKILEKENYYNFINGYKDLFIDKNLPNEEYIAGTNFHEIYSLYIFDRELRNLFIRYILEIENHFKSVLAHDFSSKYGHDNYLKISNFNTALNPNDKSKTPAQRIGEITELIAKIQKEMSSQLSKNNPMISHNILTHGYIPLWVLVNVLSLGTISKFYSLLIDKDKNDIGKRFLLKPDEITSFLYVLTIYRNACAHDERLYSLKAQKPNGKPNNIPTTPIHSRLAIPLDKAGNPVCGKNDLFSLVIIFKTILSSESFDMFFNVLDTNISNLQKELKVITIDDVLYKTGFPSNWKDIK